jgi:hypothetical protein
MVLPLGDAETARLPQSGPADGAGGKGGAARPPAFPPLQAFRYMVLLDVQQCRLVSRPVKLSTRTLRIVETRRRAKRAATGGDGDARAKRQRA